MIITGRNSFDSRIEPNRLLQNLTEPNPNKPYNENSKNNMNKNMQNNENNNNKNNDNIMNLNEKKSSFTDIQLSAPLENSITLPPSPTLHNLPEFTQLSTYPK